MILDHDERAGILFPDAVEPKKRQRRRAPVKLTNQRQNASESLCNAIAEAAGGLNGDDDDKFRIVCLSCDLFADEVPLNHIKLTTEIVRLVGKVRKKADGV